MRFLLGMIIIAGGFVLVWQANWIVTTFGHVPWAEKYLGSEGGSRLFWKLMGILVIFIAMLYMFGFIEGVIWSVFGSLFGQRN
ncbi:MAG: hypothetical protein Q8O59_03180 [bacterium]|nr:hypothetical protein [bacterium]